MLEGILFCRVICMGHTTKSIKVKAGDVFGKLTVLHDNTTRVVMVRCECGKEYEIRVRRLFGDNAAWRCQKCAGAARRGSHLSDEAKAKMNAAWRGRHHSEESKAKISASNTGRVVSDEVKARISATQKGIPKSDETKARMSNSHKKRWAGKRSHFWRGGRHITNRGYITIFSPDHPNKNTNNVVPEHRLVMEKMLGRYLDPCEIVHHIDGDKTNNVESNLMLFPSISAHNQHHAALRKEEKRRG